jgi:ribonuclease HI/exonuclease III
VCWNADHLKADYESINLLHENFGNCDLLFLQEAECMNGARLPELCPPLARSHHMIDPESRNGVATLVRRDLMQDVVHITNTREYQIVVLHHNAVHVCFANVHLPDAVKCDRLGICLRTLLDNLCASLQSALDAFQLHSAFLVGDLNTEFTPGGDFGKAVSGLVMDARAHMVKEKLDQFLFCWDSTHVEDPNPYSHIHKVTKRRSTLDYALHCTTAGNKAALRCEFAYDMGFCSDHVPILLELRGWKKGAVRKKPCRAFSRPRMHEVAVQNRYAALLDDCLSHADPDVWNSSFSALEFVASSITKSQARASKETPEADKDATLREFCSNEIDILNNSQGEARRDALKDLNKKKKEYFRKRARENLCKSALQQPREGKQKHSGTCPINVQGILSNDPKEWQPAFTQLYKNLFHDAENGPAEQESRLQRLRAESKSEAHIPIPLSLLQEHLAKGRAKCKTAPGLDGTTWASLVHLPHRAVIALRAVFEARINAYDCSLGVVRAWRDVLLHLIPKVQNPSEIGHWRPISLCSVLQKLFLSVVAAVIDFHEVLDPLQRGFRPGGQTMEVGEALRTLAKKCVEWGQPLYLLKADIARAFDNICHGALEGAMREQGIPAKLRHAVFQELDCEMLLSCQSTIWRGDIRPSKGGRQGGSETPTLWNILLSSALKRARTRWHQEGLGWRFVASDIYTPYIQQLIGDEQRLGSAEDPLWVPYLAWADDLVLVAKSEHEILRLWVILSDEISSLRLAWKPGSLELYSPGRADANHLPNLSWKHGESTFEVKQVAKICILGILLSENASDLAACKYRISQGWTHFMSRRKILCNRLVPLHLRWARLQETVMRTVLYGAGGWSMTEQISCELQTFERKVLGLTLNLHRAYDVLPQDFHAKINAKITFFMDQFAWTHLRTSVENLGFGWLGHIVRLGLVPVSLATLWRPAEFVREAAEVRRAKRGRPNRDPTERISQLYGPAWEEIALERSEWRLAKGLFLQTECANDFRVVGQGAGEWRLHKHISSRSQEMLRGTRMLLKSPLMISGDSSLVVQYINGRWRPAADCVFVAQIKRARWLLYALEFGWKFEPYTCEEPLLVQRPRACNNLADSLCNFALDNEANVQHFWDLGFDPRACPVHVSFDGASRGNPGPSSVAAVVQVHCAGVWLVAAAKCYCLGHGTSNEAEFEAAIAAMQLLIDWCIRCGVCV